MTLSSTGATSVEQPPPAPQQHQQTSPAHAPESTAIARGRIVRRGVDSFDPFASAMRRLVGARHRSLRNGLRQTFTARARLPPRAGAHEQHSPFEAPSALERSQVASQSDTASSNTRAPHVTRNAVAVAAGSRSIYSALYAYPFLALLFIVLSGSFCTSPSCYSAI